MPQYKERTVVIKAITVQSVLTAIINNNLESLPAWVENAIIGGLIVKQPGNFISVTTPVGKRVGGTSDTLIRSMTGELSVMPTARFNNLYEEL